MFKRFSILMTLLLALSLVASPAAGQTFEFDDPEETGMLSGYGRAYIEQSLFEAMMGEGEAEGDGEEMDAELPTVMMMMVMGLEFDSPDFLEGNLDTLACETFGSLIELEETITCDDLADHDIEMTEVEDLGDHARELSANTGMTDDLGYGGATNALFIQDGNWLYMIVQMGSEIEAGSGVPFAEYIVDAEIVDAEVMFDEGGFSTGGFFDKLPGLDDPIIEGFMPMMDMDMSME